MKDNLQGQVDNVNVDQETLDQLDKVSGIDIGTEFTPENHTGFNIKDIKIQLEQLRQASSQISQQCRATFDANIDDLNTPLITSIIKLFLSMKISQTPKTKQLKPNKQQTLSNH